MFKHAILLDIDGTSTGSLEKGYDDFLTLNPRLKKIINRLTKDGHIVCFSTGRTFFGAMDIYKDSGLNTYLSSFNGAYISNPYKKDTPIIFPLLNEIVKNIINEKEIKENILNLLINKEDLSTLTTNDEDHYKTLFLRNDSSYFKGGQSEIMEKIGSDNVIQIILEFPREKQIIESVVKIFRKYRYAIDFYSEKKLFQKEINDKVLSVDDKKITFRIRNKVASKGSAARVITALYNIPLERTLAFGNDTNDLPVLNVVGRGIVTHDSDVYLKSLAYDVTNENKYKINSESVSDYLSEFFGYNF